MTEEIKITNEEVERIKIDGGRRLCDYAIEQWASGKYRMDEKTTQENISRWKKIKEKI